MKTIETHGTFNDTISGSSAEMQRIAEGLRQLIIDVYPDVIEVPWPKQRIIGYGVGPKKMSEHFCYIGMYKEHVNLGFYYGAELDDLEGLMEGTGKKLRHIKVSDINQIKAPSLRDLIRLSLEERESALGNKR